LYIPPILCPRNPSSPPTRIILTHSQATDNGPQEGWDAITFHKFGKIVEKSPESGIQRMDLRFFFENKVKDAGVLSEGTGKIWYEELVGLEYIEKGGLPEGVEFGYDMSTWLIDVQVYLRW
jgi:D-amino-acid oxidase